MLRISNIIYLYSTSRSEVRDSLNVVLGRKEEFLHKRKDRNTKLAQCYCQFVCIASIVCSIRYALTLGDSKKKKNYYFSSLLHYFVSRYNFIPVMAIVLPDGSVS